MSDLPEHTMTVRIPRVTLNREIHHTFVKTRFGYHIHTTYGPMHVGEAPMFAFTLKRAEKKARRLADRLRRNERRRAEARTVEG